ncbi:hypothetical protein [Desulfitobacterium metallireducens]|uniref:Uncharacterized protein n=1 Tax=Desulfitobacterium metallireducens DSM 15288 TaxID=871968 RepID=W0EFZ6_9FIRM|nr:hypothetical protein [Desulfitobacterium metallireducens]AHF08001.1 hypothetical protein DESME_13910 [Desulfitobacterium metallireducens DSM 15288]
MSQTPYGRPVLKNDITHPITLIAFLIVLALGTWLIIHTWF